MLENTKILALIPARGGSKGLPGKNLRLLGGMPLVAWPIRAALGSLHVDRVIVSTDDLAIKDAALHAGAGVPFIRPPHLALDTSSSMDVVQHALDELHAAGEHYDYVVMLEPTSPLTTSTDVDAALTQLHSARAIADSIVGIARVEATHPEYDVRRTENGLLSPYLAPDFRSLRRRQDIEELYFFEGSVYISDVEVFRRERSFYHSRTMGYLVPRWKSLEIDELVDLHLAEVLIKKPEL